MSDDQEGNVEDERCENFCDEELSLHPIIRALPVRTHHCDSWPLVMIVVVALVNVRDREREDDASQVPRDLGKEDQDVTRQSLLKLFLFHN